MHQPGRPGPGLLHQPGVGIFGRRNAARHTIRYTANANSRGAEVRAALDLTYRYVELYQEQSEELLAQPMGVDDFLKWEHELFGVPENGEQGKNSKTMTENRDRVLVDLFRTSETNEFGPSTRYAAAQSVIEYLDHEAIVRGAGDPDGKRWASHGRADRGHQGPGLGPAGHRLTREGAAPDRTRGSPPNTRSHRRTPRRPQETPPVTRVTRTDRMRIVSAR